MARPSGKKTRNGGQWTEARFKSFVVNQLRSATRKWGPIGQCEKEARTRRGFYRCACCEQEIPATVKEGRKRSNNKFVDHIKPAVPVTGWTNFDDYINNLFCEVENLQLLCKKCHDEKSMEEVQERKKHR